MTSTDPLNLDAIEARATAATPGPWRDADTHLGRHGHTATVLSGTGNDTDLRAWLPSLSQEAWDETRNVWADAAFVAAARTDVDALLAEVRRLRNAMEQIRNLHTDSPMGPCPVCIDADAAAAGGDGLVPYPCPTGRLAGAQDCEPPHVRAAADIDPICGDENDGDWCELDPGHNGHHRADTAEWAAAPAVVPAR